MKKLVFICFIFIACRIFSQNPSVEFTFVPGWNHSDQLQGRVHNTSPVDHGMAVYIFLEEAGGWWTKPTFADPVTMIQPDSTFTTTIVTGGIDQYATRIIAFLLPLSVSPPLMPGGEIPDSMFNYPYMVSCRPHGERLISWSGFDWVVKRSINDPPLPMGPGPNIFNDNDTMVWVDAQQRLHLRLAKKDGTWHCSEVICTSSPGYGLYEFDVGSRVDMLDPRIINGIFTWDDCSPYALPPNDYFREIDIEFSRWGDPYNKNSQYVIQPYSIYGNVDRFDMDLTGIDHSVHSFSWNPGSILFHSSWGSSSYSWNYTDPGYIPLPGMQNVRINLYLMNGWPPFSGSNAEVILNSAVTGNPEGSHPVKDVRIYPNPASAGCQIIIRSETPEETEIELLDLQGIILNRIFKGKTTPGSNRIEWNGKGESGYPVRPGLYIICIRDKNETRNVKILKW